MSKSKGNVVYPEPIVDAFDSFGAPGNDALRYYLLREAPFGQDMSFSYDGLIQRYNSDLANDLGNLASRTIAMIGSYFDGKVPEPSAVPDFQLLIDKMKDSAIAARNDFLANFENYDLSRGLESVWEFVGAANGFLVQTGPWLRAKRDLDAERANIAAILYCAAEALRFATALLYPVIPTAAERIWKQLGCEGRVDDKWLELDSEGQVKLKWGQLKPGAEVGKPEPVFPAFRNEKKEMVIAKLYELAEADRERDKPKEALKSVQTEKNNEAAPVLGHEQTTVSPEPPVPGAAPVAEQQKISIEDFAKVEMRVGEVKAAEHVPGATKLLKLMVDIGTEIRQVVAGLAEAYEPESLIGMKVAVVTNLQPRKLRGVESNGMVIAASEEHGRPVLVTFKDDIANGARLK
jgi:methionyl-tRNA synthetase